jgi:hypothetical protein
MTDQEFIDKITEVLKTNLPLENRELEWDLCFNYSSKWAITQAHLDNMANTNLCYGFFGGTQDVNTDESHVGRAEYSFRKLAEALGTHPDFESIEKKLGFKIELPSFIGGRRVVMTDRGILTDRHCHYLWVLKRIRELCPDKNSRIIEIGSGLGLLGYFLDRAGYKDYTSIDLAYPSLCQSYFLYKNLPDRRMLLSGDNTKPFRSAYSSHLKLLHSSDFKNVKDRWDIMVNMDSLPEMTLGEAGKYICSEVPLLLSINRESYNLKVEDIAIPFRNRLYRHPFTLRNDSEYFEELYQKR